MSRTPNNLRPRKNPTEERLRATPFKSVAELEAEAEAIRLNVWRRFDEARVIHELLTKPQYKFVLDEWQHGLEAIFDHPVATKMYRIYSDGKGIKLCLNKDFTATLGDHEVRFFEGVVRAGIEGFGTLYMSSKGLLGAEAEPDSESGKGFGSKRRLGKKKRTSPGKSR